MRKALLLLVANFCALPGRAQLVSNQAIGLSVPKASVSSAAPAAPESVVLNYAEQMPAFPGGTTALHQFLVTHITYPPEAFKAGRSGSVVVQFVVDEQGRTRDVEAVRTSDPEFDTTAKYVVLMMPWWTPGLDKGQPVRVRCTLPINFTFRRNP